MPTRISCLTDYLAFAQSNAGRFVLLNVMIGSNLPESIRVNLQKPSSRFRCAGKVVTTPFTWNHPPFKFGHPTVAFSFAELTCLSNNFELVYQVIGDKPLSEIDAQHIANDEILKRLQRSSLEIIGIVELLERLEIETELYNLKPTRCVELMVASELSDAGRHLIYCVCKAAHCYGQIPQLRPFELIPGGRIVDNARPRGAQFRSSLDNWRITKGRLAVHPQFASWITNGRRFVLRGLSWRQQLQGNDIRRNSIDLICQASIEGKCCPAVVEVKMKDDTWTSGSTPASVVLRYRVLESATASPLELPV